MLITADTVLTGRELLRPGWIDVVARIGRGGRRREGPPRPADRDLGAVTVVPGFVDTHLHGGGGANFSTAATRRNRHRGRVPPHGTAPRR